MIKKPDFVNDFYYHIYNRGVEKRPLFIDSTDCSRFIENLYDFNDTNPTPEHRFPRNNCDLERKKLVDIYCYVLMPNHFHLLLRQLKDDGIQKFMRKLGIGYAMYFNNKQDRVGPLFQGRFKAKSVESDEQLMHLSRYIHLNPLKIFEKNWPKEKIKDKKAASGFIEKYPWSSYGTYIGEEEDPLLADDYAEIVTPQGNYREFVEEFTYEIF